MKCTKCDEYAFPMLLECFNNIQSSAEYVLATTMAEYFMCAYKTI